MSSFLYEPWSWYSSKCSVDIIPKVLKLMLGGRHMVDWLFDGTQCRVATGQGKVREIQGQGKVREIYNLSGKF